MYDQNLIFQHFFSHNFFFVKLRKERGSEEEMKEEKLNGKICFSLEIFKKFIHSFHRNKNVLLNFFHFSNIFCYIFQRIVKIYCKESFISPIHMKSFPFKIKKMSEKYKI
jgi:hypothetical protein